MILPILLLLLVGYAIAWMDPGGYSAWETVRQILAPAILSGFAWSIWSTTKVWPRIALPAAAVVLIAMQCGIPALRADACGSATLGSSSWRDCKASIVRSDCGATTGYLYQVTLSSGTGWLRRKQILIKAYMDPEPVSVTVDSTQVRVRLRLPPTDSIAESSFSLAAPGETQEYFRGVLNGP